MLGDVEGPDSEQVGTPTAPPHLWGTTAHRLGSPTVKGIPSDAHAGALPHTRYGGLVHGLRAGTPKALQGEMLSSARCSRKFF